VHLTRDGELVVSHDATLERCTNGEGPLADKTLAELQRLDAGYHFTTDWGPHLPLPGPGRAPALAARAAARLPGDALQHRGEAGRAGHRGCLPAAAAQEGALERVVVGSELDEVAERWCASCPTPATSTRAMRWRLRARPCARAREPPDDRRYTVLDMPLYFGEVRLVDKALLRAWRAGAAGSTSGRWTTGGDAPAGARGVGGIMTDRPDLLRQVFDAHEKPR
jgi:glycerophosphoryl diester phosphodiesterase